MSDDVTITVRVNNQTQAGIRDVNGQLRTLDGRFAASAGNMRRSSSAMSRALVDVRGALLSLAPAAVPVAASLAPIAVQAGAAGLAVGALGAALVPQIANLKDAADAQDKYTDAVTKYGQNSKQAAEAQAFVANTLKGMPAATQRAAAAYSNLRDQFKGFSDSTAKFTMVPVEHSFAVLGALLPKLTPMAQSASGQLDRLVKVAGGAINTSGFDTLSKKVSDFANRSLRDATDKAIHFIRVMSEGNAKGPITEFMAYAKAQGPAVKELLSNLVKAIGNIAQGAAQAGPGLLTIVNAFAKLVAAVPPQLIGNLMQVYAAFKLIKLAGAGIAGLAGGFQSLAGKVTALQAASAAAGGGLAGLKAAFLALGTAAKASIVVAGLALLAVGIKKLSELGKSAPPNVDRLTTALGKLGATGKVTGEAASKFGAHFEKLKSQIDKVLDPSVAESINNWGAKITGGLLDAGDATEEFTKSVGAIDTSLADLVRGGKADLAKAALADMMKGMRPDEVKKFRGELDDYKSALADQALEQKLAAESMGVFGQAAQDTSAKLQAQKNSADALRQSIFALNDVNRSAYESQIQFEQAVNDLTASFKKNGATLDLHTQAGRDNAKAMSDAAKSQDELIASGVAAGDSLSSMTKRSGELRAEMLKLATQAFGGNKKKAEEYVNTLLGIPSDIKTLVELERKDAISGLKDLQTEISKTPGAKSITVDTLNGAAIKALEAVGLKTRQLPDGKTEVYTANGKALGSIDAVRRALNNLNGKKATTWTYNNIKTTHINETIYRTKGSLHDVVGATGGLFTGSAFKRGYAGGGMVSGPGTGTSDDVFAPWLSSGEFVMKAAAVRKYGEKFMQALNEGRLQMPRFARGGKVSASEAEARNAARWDLSVSHFGRMAGWRRDEFSNAVSRPDSIGSLVAALNQWRGIIQKATHGGTENRLLKQLDSTGRSLMGYQRKLDSVTKSLEGARNKLNDLKSAAASLSDSVKSGILSGANITRAATAEDSRVTINTILSQMRGSAANATEFDQALKALKGKGLSADLLSQIAQAGIEGGGLETAQALLGASPEQLKQLNQLQGQINRAAGSAGTTAADAVFGPQIRAQETYVKSLEAQQRKLTASMDKLGQVIEKAIKAAFGQKAAGGIVGAAASGGVRSSLTWVGEQGPELLDLPSGSRVWSNPDSRRRAAAPWASMLTTRRGRAQAAYPAASGGSDRPIVLHVNLANREFGQIWVDVGRKEVKTRGGLSATLGG